MNSEQVYDLIKLQLNGDESFEEIERLVDNLCNQFNLDFSKEVLNRFRSQATEKSTPKLLVKWGELPQIGHHSCPEFNLLCPGYLGKPMISIRVAQNLDHDPKAQLHSPKQEQEGLWSFFVPFQLTTNQMDCRPGIYFIEVDIYFREVPKGYANFYRSLVRLNVKSSSDENGAILEIDGDGESVVNLHGYDLKQFSKVVLKGGQDGIINLQNTFGQSPAAPSATVQQTVFEYKLKPDLEKQKRIPTRLSRPLTQQGKTDRACLLHEDGRNTLLIANNSVTFGRSRDNDIILRFLPKSDENDNSSRYLSRTHLAINLGQDGLELIDLSNTGVEFDYDPIKEKLLFMPRYSGHTSTRLELGSKGLGPKVFGMELHLYSMERELPLTERYFWHSLYTETLGSHMSRLHQDSIETGIDAVRLERETNLKDQESYILLYREALIGSSVHSASILVESESSRPFARILHIDRRFWLERIQPSGTIRLNDTELKLHDIVPLEFGNTILAGQEKLVFTSYSQLYLGE